MVTIIIIFVFIHLLEIAGVVIFLQDRKNKKLEGIIDQQNAFMTKLSDVVKISRERLNELDQLGAFRSDDELGIFFENLKVIQGALDEFTVRDKS